MTTLSTQDQTLVYGATLRDRLHGALRETPWWLISLVVHGAILVFAHWYTWESKVPEEEVRLESKIEEKYVPPPITFDIPKPVEKVVERTKADVVKDNKVTLEQKDLPELNLKQEGNPNPDTLTVLAALGGVIPVGRIGDGKGLHVGGENIGDSIGDMSGWPGWKSRCLAVWLFDESKSMKDDQQLVRQKVDELYESLGIAGGSSTDKRVMTAVCSYGKDFRVILKEPTGDMQKIRDAIDRIPVDESGKENYLAAINGVLNEFSGYAKKYSRNIVVILVTDEGGDDDTTSKEGPPPLEVTVARMKASKASLLVFGYEAGAFAYASEQTYDPTVKAGVSPWAWVYRGLDTAFSEMLPHDYHFRGTERVPSGFGPFGMSRLCRETGGIYYLLRAAGAKSYDYDKMLKGYQPEIDSRLEVAARNGKNPARKLLMTIVDGWNAIRTKEEYNWRYYYNNNEAGRKQMEAAMRVTGEWLDMVDDAIKRMGALANVSFADTASQKRWEANRDLMWAQLHKQRFQLVQYRLALDDLMKMRNVPPPGDIGWSIGYWRNPVLRGDVAAMQEERAKVQAMYQEVVDKHDGTPWAVFARSESRGMRGFDIQPWSSSTGTVTIENR